MEKEIIDTVENQVFPDGYVLKKYKLKQWIYDNGYTQPYVAKKLGLEPDEFKRKLREKEAFNRDQIAALIRFMKAENAFNVIFFSSKRMRKKVWWQVFGKFKDEGGSE
ncbi:MAG: hypothetical protein ACI4MZ_04585 [Christensenellales bacterium]